jgi:hypothetical protein
MFVVGISATATISSITRNFDLEYLKNNTTFSTLDNNEIEHMNELYYKLLGLSTT